MNSVVMISYWFPPDGCAAVYRPLRFVRHLPGIGWSPRVIAADRHPYTCNRYDPGLLAAVPKSVAVTRVRSRDPWQAVQSWRARRGRKNASLALRQGGGAPDGSGSLRPLLRRAARKIEACCYHPDEAMGWIRPAVQATLKLCWRERPRVLWATAGPVSSFVVAERAGRAIGVPYVLDFRDSWTITYNEFEETRPAWAKCLDRRRMYKLLRNARAVVFRFATEAECFWRFYPGALEPSRIHLIPNGYEGPVEEFCVQKGPRCQIIHAGTVSDYRYDSLLEALRIFKEQLPEPAKKLSLVFIGEGSEALGERAGAMGLSDLVTARAATSHAEATEMTRAAHALLILGRPATMRGHELFAGAKLFGYLKAGRPIVGVLPLDETRKILQGVGVATLADADSVSDIVAVLERLVQAWSKHKLVDLLPDPARCAEYSAERQTAALARALEGRAAAEPFVPGAREIPPSLRHEFVERRGEREAWYCRLSAAAK
jgi:hypothetical protein